MSPSWSYISHNRSLQGTPKGWNPCIPMERKPQQFLVVSLRPPLVFNRKQTNDIGNRPIVTMLSDRPQQREPLLKRLLNQLKDQLILESCRLHSTMDSILSKPQGMALRHLVLQKYQPESQAGANWPPLVLYSHLAISCRHWPPGPIFTPPTPRPSSLFLGPRGFWATPFH
ncbi:hypothetical protein O181_025047 [Austropuccinia psidii MF-1]|uniref:Uncharacterized protein n=1 Tax=Austropuccinia psidii MF-1 TaxID=1389203 RepID=A0A9Q3CKF1_9BASI|nr:hypothetical protein [Austropuccinia psidii MF-1]